MGGNRHHTVFNLLVVWFITGLWHGASWNFVFWGLWWGVLIGLEKFFGNHVKIKFPAFLGHLYLIFSALLSWVLFYFTNLQDVIIWLGAMFGAGSRSLFSLELQIAVINDVFLLAVAIVACTTVPKKLLSNMISYFKNNGSVLQNLPRFLAPVIDICLLLLCTALLAGQSYNPFLYFRF